MKTSCGGVVINQSAQVLLREPKGRFDGYVWTFAKGLPNPEESPEKTALREVLEEAGVNCVNAANPSIKWCGEVSANHR